MYGKSVSESGKKVSEAEMTSTALIEAKGWACELMNREYKGRYRVSKITGIPESYLFRLQYKTGEMKDVAGSVYRALMIAVSAYDRICQANEDAAARYRAERLTLRDGNAADQEPRQ
jgi:hypothetical protein